MQVTQNTEALQGALTEVNDLRRQVQTLEIELESQKNLVRVTACLLPLCSPRRFIRQLCSDFRQMVR